MRSFKIPTIPQTSQKSIRFPNNLIKEVEEIIKGKDCTFTAFVVEATKVAVTNVKEEKESSHN